MHVIDETMLPSVRWDILRTLQVGGHLGATETMVRRAIEADYLAVTKKFVRDQFAYLEERGLIKVQRSEIQAWRAVLARFGWDIVQYQVPCDPGIRRPPRITAGDE